MDGSGPTTAAVLTTQWLLIGIALALIAARFYLRLKIQRRRLLASDMLICSSWISSVVLASFNNVFASRGALRPDVSPQFVGYKGSLDDLKKILKLFWICNFPFYSTIYLCKAAILAVYVELFPRFMKKRRMLLWATIAFCGCAYMATLLSYVFICMPIDRNWSITAGACPAKVVPTLFQVGWALKFAGDIMIFSLPFSILPKLQMNKKMKIGVYCTFLLGVVDIAFSLTRFLTLYLTDLTAGTSVSLSLVALYGALEINIGLIIACLPALRPYLRSSPEASYLSSNANQHSSKKTADNQYSHLDQPQSLKPERSASQWYSTTTEALGGSDGDLCEDWDDGQRSRTSDIALVETGKKV